MRYFMIACMALGITLGCAHQKHGYNDLLKTWKGTHGSALAEKLGNPDRAFPDDKGGEVLVYRYDRTTEVHKPDPTMRMGTRRGVEEVRVAGYIIVREYYLDPKGVVYDVKEKKERIGLAKWDAEATR